MIAKKVLLQFSKKAAGKPVICELSRKYDLTFNVMEAKISPKKEGLMILELIGTENAYNSGIEYLKESGIEISNIEDRVFRDDDLCYHCGYCLPVCPTDALIIDDRQTMKVSFYKDRCIACELCVKVCPTKAMKIRGLDGDSI